MEVGREELEKLVAEALLRDPAFRPKGRAWAGTAEEDARRARITAAAIVAFLHGCGVRWERRPPAKPHRTPGA